jgi:hypothetical protein
MAELFGVDIALRLAGNVEDVLGPAESEPGQGCQELVGNAANSDREQDGPLDGCTDRGGW